MEDTGVIKLIYTFFLGLLLALFVGFGINTFYPAPEEPEYPAILETYGEKPTDAQIKAQAEFDKQQSDFSEKRMNPYNRNVSVIVLAVAVVLLAISLLLERYRVDVISSGVMLGGLFTLFYGLMRGFASQDSKYSFIAVTVGLIVVIFLGYHRFANKPRKQATAKKSA